jgi:hypothetical protein
MLTVEQLTHDELARYNEAAEAMRLCNAGPQQCAQTLANKLLEIEFQRRPRSERALPSGAFMTSGRKWTAPDAVRYFGQTEEERKAEDARVAAERDDPNFIRKQISQEHRKLSTEGGDPAKLTALLARKRRKAA